DAGRAFQDNPVVSVLTQLRPKDASGQVASVRFTLMLSFVPYIVFDTLTLRRYLRADRQGFEARIKRYQNPSTPLDSDVDRDVRDLLRRRAAGARGLKGATDDDIKRMIVRSCRRLPREREAAMWDAIGLDKTIGTEDSRQAIWDLVALPLLRYLEPYAPARKDVQPRVIPDRLFAFTSRLLAVRSAGRWEDIPGRLKARYYARS